MFKTLYKRILFLAFIVIITSCNTPIIDDNKYEELTEKPDQESWDVRITITNAGLKRVDIKADYLEQFNDKGFITLENNVQIDFYNAEEHHMSSLLADKAEMNERTNFLRAIDNIIVKSDSGVTLYTDTLSWDNTKELIFTDDSVMITTETNDTLYGIGFESDMNMERWKILKPRGVTSR
jgi:LPS export ABC transporter protein LptC